jgi:cysteinyl-tRNA synthetase
VFRLFDSRTGRAGPLTPARRGRLTTYLAGPAAAGAGLADLRAALVADLIRRVGERHHLLVTLWQRGTGDGGADDAAAGLRAACDALNIHPAQHGAARPDPPDVQVGGEPPDGAVRWLRPAGVRGGGAAGDGAWPAGLAERGLDPLALRLALLWRHHQQPAELGWDAAGAADQALRRWREQVAGWARSPSEPMRARYLTRFTEAFDDDLDTPAALAVLDALAGDEEVAAGSKFEAFAHFDHLLGLDLAREIGR